MIALLAYEASEDPVQLSRARRVPPTDPKTGKSLPRPRVPRARSWCRRCTPLTPDSLLPSPFTTRHSPLATRYPLLAIAAAGGSQ